MKRLLAFFLTFIIIFLNGCSKEEKFGVEQFVTRMNKIYATEYKTTDFLWGKNEEEENCLFYDYGNYLLVLRLNNENQITEVGLLTTDDSDITQYIDEFCRICSVFSGIGYYEQINILNECGISNENIKKTDSNWNVTVGKYRYSVVCNNYSITLFCAKI